MSRYDRFKALTGINEEYILESMPDHFNTRAAKRRGANPVVRFFGSGWGVACICAVVAYQVQVVSWYDNENSYTSQMVRTIKYFAEI